jgi:regulator of replication initiation timing
MDSVTIMEIMRGIGEIKGDLGGLKQDVANVKEDVGELKEDVKEVKAETSTIKSDVYNLKEILNGYDNRLKSLESEPFSIKHIAVFGKWLFSKAGLYMLVPALAVINVILAKLKLPSIDLSAILTFFGSP